MKWVKIKNLSTNKHRFVEYAENFEDFKSNVFKEFRHECDTTHVSLFKVVGMEPVNEEARITAKNYGPLFTYYFDEDGNNSSSSSNNNDITIYFYNNLKPPNRKLYETSRDDESTHRNESIFALSIFFFTSFITFSTSCLLYYFLKLI